MSGFVGLHPPNKQKHEHADYASLAKIFKKANAARAVGRAVCTDKTLVGTYKCVSKNSNVSSHASRVSLGA